MVSTELKNSSKTNLTLTSFLYGLAFVFVCMNCTGCSNDILDPTQIGRFRPVPVVNVILDSLGVGNEPASPYASAEEPRPEDVVAYEQDYVFGIADVLRINIYELLAENQPFLQEYVIRESGQIYIPEVGTITAAGLTETQLQEHIRDILQPSILLDPSVTVTLWQSQSRTFDISGAGVGGSGRQAMPRYNYRLREAIASAGGVAQHNVTNIYITRNVTGQENISQPTTDETGYYQQSDQKNSFERNDIKLQPAAPERHTEPIDEDELLDLISPYAKKNKRNRIVIASSEMATEDELRNLRSRQPSSGRGYMTADVGNGESGGERVEWIFDNGKWVAVRVGGGDTSKSEEVQPRNGRKRAEDVFAGKPESLEEPVTKDYGWDQIGGGGVQTRLIKVPVDKLLSGDPRYNIIIKPGDSISVPLDIIGEFYVMGNLNASGPIPLTGRPMTLKMAVATAGGLGQLAWPSKVEVTRRLDDNREVIIMVDLAKIAKGIQPDFYIKPNDLINVGTHGTARWLAVLRNSFRASYGFSFMYSRNFANSAFAEGLDDFLGFGL
jgi:protein involved in polysaccharide export with SLBB domain